MPTTRFDYDRFREQRTSLHHLSSLCKAEHLDEPYLSYLLSTPKTKKTRVHRMLKQILQRMILILRNNKEHN
ncbi:MAG: hypothetical protein EOM15_06650 [Spirochaetia bacterium]|nr:hypothetical protein [Spirochaetia bacterium]